MPGQLADLERCRPVYETLPGWTEDLTKARSWADLPAAARDYVTFLGRQIGVPVSIVSVGPDRTQTITDVGSTGRAGNRRELQGIMANATITEEGLARLAAAGLRPEQLPRHVAIIMDGNGRWAQSRGMPRIVGHRRGIQSVRAVVEEGCRLGLDQLTLYCLSVENWKRPPRELKFLLAPPPPLPASKERAS